MFRSEVEMARGMLWQRSAVVCSVLLGCENVEHGPVALGRQAYAGVFDTIALAVRHGPHDVLVRIGRAGPSNAAERRA
jgi:hypothetical protein